MDLHLQDKTVIVTGGASGIGAAISLQLAREGAVPAICGKSPMPEAFREELMALQPRARFYQLDLTSEHACRDMVADVAVRFGGIDGLVNNAGVKTASAWRRGGLRSCSRSNATWSTTT